LGEERAAAVYRAIAQEEIRRTAPRGDEYERRLFFAPPCGTSVSSGSQARISAETLVPQGGGDLGARMSDAIEQSFRGGARRVAVIGTDAPAVGREDVLEALESLDDHDL